MVVKWLSDSDLCTNRVNMFAIVYFFLFAYLLRRFDQI